MSRFNIVLAIFVTMLEIAPRLALASPNDTEVNEYLQSELQHIATLNERSDVAGTRLYISGSPVINSAIIWQADGKQRYPATAQVLHVLDQPVIAAEKRLKALAELALPWRAEKVDASGAELFYCYRTQQIICALLNVEQLAAVFSVSPDEVSIIPNPPALETAEASRLLAIQPIGAWIIGYLTPESFKNLFIWLFYILKIFSKTLLMHND